MSATPERLDPLRLPLHGSRLIEASAGTGKTYTIAALYLRLVLGHGELPQGVGPLTPPQILVMTFTEAATRELRDRIRARLTQAARVFREGTAPDDDAVLAGLLAAHAGEGERERAARRLEVAAEWMDEAAVSTIHSWCYRMLREHAFDSGSLFTQNLEADQQDLLAEAARDYWRSFVYPLPTASVRLLRGVLGPGPEALLARIRPLVGQVDPGADDLAGLDSPDGLAAALGERLERVDALKRAWREDPGAVEEQFRELYAGVLDKRKYAKPDRLLEVMREWAGDPARMQPQAVGKVSVLERMSAAGMAERLKSGAELPEPLHPAFHALDEHAAACGDDSPRLLRAAAAQVDRLFRRAQRQRAQMGFNDLLTRLRDALNGPGGDYLAATLRTQFPVALVDEFQDTDPVQYRIFERVYRIPDNPPDLGLLLIGDPKQAIYGFRGADIHSYLGARRATEGRHYTLPRNFRSTESLVAGVNRLFARAETWPDGAFLFRQGDDNQLPFAPVEARGRGERFEYRGHAAPALTLWWHDEGQAVPKTRYREMVAEACASRMVELLNAGQTGDCGFRDGQNLQPVRPRDMAVLVRKRDEANAIQQALRQRGVRSVYLSDRESVFATPEAGDVLRWLRACAEPTSERLLRAALATATLGLPLAELHRLTVDDLRWEATVEQFRDYRRLWQRRGVLPMLRRLLHDFEVPRRLVASGDGERALTNLLHLSELLQQAATELDGEQALIRHLAEHREGGGNGGEEQILRLESDEDLVKVVTLHKSKGLEYPLVFLPFVCNFRPVETKDVPRLDRRPDAKPQWVFHMDDEVRQRADRERLAEDLRLLYVGMTRARHACWLGLAPMTIGNRKQNRLHESSVGYLLAGTEGIAEGELESALQAAAGGEPAIRVEPLPVATAERCRAVGQAESAGRARRVERAVREPWWVASYSALAVHDTPTAPEEAAAVAPDTALEDVLREGVVETARAMPEPAAEAPASGLHAFPRGPGPGTFLHGVLEWAAEQGFAEVRGQPARLAGEVQRRCERRGWGEWAPVVQDWMERLLAAPFELEGGPAFTLGGLAIYQPELEFLYETRWLQAQRLDALVREQLLPGLARPPAGATLLNGMLKGFVDLVFAHDGRYFVADYKSNWLGPGPQAYTPEALRAAVLERRYDLQLVLYTLALHRQLAARLPNYDYDRDMGGGVYLFLRGVDAPGQGVFHHCPPRALIEQLDAWITTGPDMPGEGAA